MPVVRSQRKMLKRNLLYTGITRAQKFLILCGEREEFKAGIQRADELNRQTSLQERLQAYGEGAQEADVVEETVVHDEQVDPLVDYALTTATMLAVDPMIGMQGTTPYTFLQDVD